MSAAKLTAAQLDAIVTIERTCSILSLAGCAFIMITFSCRSFQKPINRLVFFASIGNIITNIATLISRSALTDAHGALCQFQGFMIQTFMCADAYWTLAMAYNVYLTFFHRYDAHQLRRMEKWYFMLCYRLPLIPGVVYLFVKNPDSHDSFYGDAVIWCWVSADFDVMRIATFYAPVWVAIIITFVIYLRAGREIYQKRKQLKNFKKHSQSTKTTEIHMTNEIMDETEQAINLSRLGRLSTDQPLYSVSVSAILDSESSAPSLLPSEQVRGPYTADGAAWSYTKVAILFFTAMLVTWIPSTANCAYSIVRPGCISSSLQLASSFVLPLQGFWNAVIYIANSWQACWNLFSGLAHLWRIRSCMLPFSHGKPVK